jgi:amidohydrolase
MAEDFSFFQEKVPGFFFFLGAYPELKPERPPVHHTPDFMVNEKVLITGVKALATLTVDYLESKKK